MRRDEVETIFYTPDARRTALLPSVEECLATIHNELLPTALKSAGSVRVMGYLRQFRFKASLFPALLFSPLMKESATTVTLALKDVGDNAFDLRNGLPQRDAYKDYQQMYEVARDPVMQGYAQFRMGDAIGTFGKPEDYHKGIEHMEKAIAIWNAMTPQQRPPKPPDIGQPNALNGPQRLYYIEEAYYYRNFYYGAALAERDKGIALQREFARMFPDSKWAPEALFCIVLWNRWNDDKDPYLRDRDTIAATHDLIKRYPATIRASVALGLIQTDEYKDFKPDPVKDAQEIKDNVAKNEPVPETPFDAADQPHPPAIVPVQPKPTP